MSTTEIAVADELAQLETSILALPRHGQVYLLEMLTLLLEAPSPAAASPLSPAWRAEIERRLQALDDGTAVLIPGEEVLAKLERDYP